MDSLTQDLNRQPQRSGRLDDRKVRHAITIRQPIEEVFRFWRKLENLSYFMKDLKSVENISPNRSAWTVELKSGRQVKWQADVIEEIPNRLIAWKSIPNSEITTNGIVMFERAPRDLGTIVRLSMNYEVPGGKLTEWASYLTGENPDWLSITNLKRLKAYLETGEIPTTEGQPSGREETVKH